MKAPLYSYKFGPLDRVITGQGSIVSSISSRGVLAAIFKKRTAPPMTLGIFQSTPYTEILENASQQLVRLLTKHEDNLPAHLICLFYHYGDFSTDEFRKFISQDALQRVQAIPFCSPPDFQQKPISSIDMHFAYEITNESSPILHQKRLQQETRQLWVLRKIYGLTRNEALCHFALQDALKRANASYKGVPAHARGYNLFFTRLLSSTA